MSHVQDQREERVLEVTMPDGSIWQVTGEMIARAWAANRARRAAREGAQDPQALFEREYASTLLGEDPLLLERADQVYWIDIEAEAARMREPDTPAARDDQWAYERGWFVGEKRIVA